ncbi:MAG: hypothetical protein HFJ55_05350 [Clostridia bacterium]|nr:hypothetical protein [Clostridia bacterium]
MLVGENGIIRQATQAKENSKEAETREKLELVLSNAQVEKKTNIEYNENEFLDNFITKEIEKSDIKGDVAIVDKYAYEIDRSIPKIGRYLGKAEELTFPEVEATVEVAEDRKTASIAIKAKERTKGINKIEIWQAGEKLDEFTYNNIKEEITKEYIAKQNGKYTIKVYANLMNSKIVEVKEIVSVAKFEPNGNSEWKREYSAKIMIKESEDKVISAKYQWASSVVEPNDDTFIEEFKNGDTITKNEVTGKYYLWTMLETQSGKKVKCRSEAFHFDNEEPNVELTTTPETETSFTLTVTATDEHSGARTCEFYVENQLVKTKEIVEDTISYTWVGNSMSEKECYVLVTDNVGNKIKVTKKARTKLYTWEKWNTVATKQYKEVIQPQDKDMFFAECGNSTYFYSTYSINQETGTFILGGDKIGYPSLQNPGYTVSDDGKTLTQYSIEAFDTIGSSIRFNREPNAVKVASSRFGNKAIRKVAACYDDYRAYTRKITLEQEDSVLIKGDTLIEKVTSINPNEYPNSDIKDGFWYISTEIQ